VTCMVISIPGDISKADELSRSLSEGDPAIATMVIDGKLVVAVDTLLGDQHLHVARRIRAMLA